MFFAVVAKTDHSANDQSSESKQAAERTDGSSPKDEKMTSIWVYTSENHGSSIEVPMTPNTTVTDILDCVRDPVRGDGYLVAVAGDTEYILQDEDNAFSFLHQIWTTSGLPLTFSLRYYGQDVAWPPHDLEARRQQMRRPQSSQDGALSPSVGKLPGGPGDLTLTELQEMATRQQQQMEAQQQVLVAKEQRLKYLKQQEARHAQFASESERLRRIRERVESQELKLKKLRALRGQADLHRANNNNLNSELDSVKAVFNEKEKELAMAVAKVEQLTRQLKDLRNGAAMSLLSGKTQSAAAVELERLRKELLIRNKLNEEQNTTIAAKENVLREQKEKVVSMDNRIQELQQRLKKRKLQEDQSNQALKQANANKSNTKQSKADNRTDFGAHEAKSMYGTDPYIQYAPKDVAKDDSYTRAASFTKNDPKYQTLPTNVKLTPNRMSSQGGVMPRNQTNEMNNNSANYEEYKLPTVLPMGPNFSAPGQNTSSHQPSKTPRFNNNDFSKPNQNYIPQPSTRQGQNQKEKASGAHPVAPKPGFPNHSNDPPNYRNVPPSLDPPLSARGDNGISSAHPVISINEEERQAGSGQSSPASSEGSDSSGGIQIRGDDQEGINTASIGSVSAMIQKLNKGKENNQAVNNEESECANSQSSQHGANSQSSQHGANRGGSEWGRLNNKSGQDQQHPQNTSSSKQPPHPQPGTSHPANSSSSSNSAATPGSQGHTASTGPLPSSHGNQPSRGSGGEVSHPPSSQSPQLNVKPAPTYRFASKNQIANTYMGRLGGAAMDRYQLNLNKLYQNLDSTHKEAQAKSHDSADSPLGGSQSNESTSSPNQEQFGSVAPHNYPDIASDKGSYKLNTPKQVRRKHSDSENEEMNKALQEHQSYEQQAGLEENKTNNKNNVAITQEAKPQMPPSSHSSKSKEKSKQSSTLEKEKVPESPSASHGKGAKEKSSPQSPKSKVEVVRRTKSNLKRENARKSNNRVSFDPLALLLDASLEGELDLVKKVAVQVEDVSTPNDEGITALHNAICAGHFEIVKFLIEFGCDVNSPDSDGWTPLHCAASCNNLPMVRFLVEHGACVFATTISDQETAADKCEEEEDGYDGCSDYLYSIQEKLGITKNGEVYAVFDYAASNGDELSFAIGDKLTVLRKGDEAEKEWWWAGLTEKEGYIPRNLLGLYPRVIQQPSEVSEC